MSPLASPRLVKLAIVVAAAVAWRASAQRDLALHKPVRISSVRLGDPAGAVNGFVEWGSYAVHTNRDSPAWFLVDLQESHRIGEVRVYGRGDGYLIDGPPMAVEVSKDGQHFERSISCETAVTQLSPCHVDMRGAAARYVRVQHRTHLVLSEVEVFEAR